MVQMTNLLIFKEKKCLIIVTLFSTYPQPTPHLPPDQTPPNQPNPINLNHLKPPQSYCYCCTPPPPPPTKGNTKPYNNIYIYIIDINKYTSHTFRGVEGYVLPPAIRLPTVLRFRPFVLRFRPFASNPRGGVRWV